jgi:hypothetical protein
VQTKDQVLDDLERMQFSTVCLASMSVMDHDYKMNGLVYEFDETSSGFFALTDPIDRPHRRTLFVSPR